LTADEAVMVLGGARAADPSENRRGGEGAKAAPASPSTLRMKMVGANPRPRVEGQEELTVKTNYFIGSDPREWRTDVASYAKVRYAEVYRGIDLVYYGSLRQLEYDFVVAPDADPREIRLEFAGSKRIRLDGGELVLETAASEVRQRAPVAYQEVRGARLGVASRYVLKRGSHVGIDVGEYDRTLPLVIDPVLTYSTYLGGGGVDRGHGIASDASGQNVYVAGETNSTNFPLQNQYQENQPDFDAVVTRLTAADAPLDADADGTPDGEDNCPNAANLDQADADADGDGDACDPQTGPPVDKDQCKDGGWVRFDFPRWFKNQGDCIQFFNTGK
jgi:hypothetical protein